MHWHMPDTFMIKKYLTLIRSNQTTGNVETGCLARSVWSEEGDDLAFADCEIEVFHRDKVAVVLAETVGLYHYVRGSIICHVEGYG